MIQQKKKCNHWTSFYPRFKAIIHIALCEFTWVISKTTTNVFPDLGVVQLTTGD